MTIMITCRMQKTIGTDMCDDRIPQINDKVGVTINGHEYEVLVAGVERGFGKNSPVMVKFYIDWDEGPCEYRWPLRDVRLLPES